MAARKMTEFPPWRPKSRLTSEVQLHICGSIFQLDKELLASKSTKVSQLLQKNPHADVSHFLHDIPADEESMELVGRFCHGYEINLTTENVIRVTCVAEYLGMTDTHCPNNLLNKSISFLDHNIIPSWSNSIKALKTAEHVLQEALDLGIVEYCMDSIVAKVVEDPRLLGEPIGTLTTSDDDSDENEMISYRPHARRKLFDLDWKTEDLTTLPLIFYAPVIQQMINRQIPEEYLAANIYQYARTWIFPHKGDDLPTHKLNTQREIIETLVALLPHRPRLVSCAFLFEMLQSAIDLTAKPECKEDLETRIGRQLDQATVKDLLIPSRGYAKDEQYDTECVRRIVKHFYKNYTGPDSNGMIYVAELMDEFLAEISADIDLKKSTFAAFAEMSVAVSEYIQKSSDGVYRAIDIYLEKHKHLTESEREELCRVLDCNRLSPEAREHAALNERLPLRVVVQVLFVSQLNLRNTIPEGKSLGSSGRLVKVEAGEEEEEVREEIEKMGSKVMELERECSVMRREIERGGSSGVKKQKFSVWREMKRKLGCVTSNQDCDCHVKKKKVNRR